MAKEVALRKQTSTRLKILPMKATKATTATKATVKPAVKRSTVVVNINEIKTRKLAESCTKDAFKRKGWEIGLKVANGKGIAAGTPEAKAYTAEGYRLAGEYLRSIGM